jgi:hypothetical protein
MAWNARFGSLGSLYAISPPVSATVARTSLPYDARARGKGLEALPVLVT